MKQRLPLLCSVALLSLSGCGAVNSLIPEIDNLVPLSGNSVQATVGSGRAVISGNITKSVSFPDRDLPSASKLKSMSLRQSLATSVQVTVPNGVSLPNTFTLSNITLQITLSDGDRSTSSSATYAGPVTFTRTAGTSTYTTATTIEVSNISFTSAPFSTVKSIITTAPSPNTATGKLSFDAESTELPNGSTISFTFGGGKAKVAI